MTSETIGILLLIAAVVAMLARRLGVPYSIGLVLAGIGLAIAPFSPQIELTRQLIFTVLLPPLIFEAAFQIRWGELKKDLPIIGLLATCGVAIAALTTATGMHYFANWGWSAAAVFGVLIAATDPVSVIASFKDAGVRGRVRLLVEAESLFNDGTAAVALTIVLAFVSGQDWGAAAVAKTFFLVTVGSLLCGAVTAGAVLLLVGATDDHLVEMTFSIVAAYGAFLLAEHFHLSGVLATLTTGLIIGNMGRLAISSTGRRAVVELWEFVAFVANSLIFLLIGMRLTNQSYRAVLIPVIIAIVVVTAGRALAVYPLSLLFLKSKQRVSLAQQNLLFWGGLRGALALALALGLPANISQREEIVAVAFAVVAFSILIQGLTITPILRRIAANARDDQGEPQREGDAA